MEEAYAWVEMVAVAPRELLGMVNLPEGLLIQMFLFKKSFMFLHTISFPDCRAKLSAHV